MVQLEPSFPWVLLHGGSLSNNFPLLARSVALRVGIAGAIFPFHAKLTSSMAHGAKMEILRVKLQKTPVAADVDVAQVRCRSIRDQSLVSLSQLCIFQTLLEDNNISGYAPVRVYLSELTMPNIFDGGGKTLAFFVPLFKWCISPTAKWLCPGIGCHLELTCNGNKSSWAFQKKELVLLTPSSLVGPAFLLPLFCAVTAFVRASMSLAPVQLRLMGLVDPVQVACDLNPPMCLTVDSTSFSMTDLVAIGGFLGTCAWTWCRASLLTRNAPHHGPLSVAFCMQLGYSTDSYIGADP
eukprot:1148367-Pelagomonas_calceolata.AAC.1